MELLHNYYSIKKEVGRVSNCFLSFLKKYEKWKAHNILFLVLDLIYKNHHLIFFFIGHEQNKTNVEKYDKRFLWLMLLKYYHVFHPLAKFKFLASQLFDEDFSLNIF
jgi:hypothetical protein